MPSKVKITVFKKFSPEDVFGKEMFREDGTKMTHCGAFEEGQEFLVEHYEEMPKGFCMWAWKDIGRDLPVLYFDGNFHGRTIQYTSCSDGRKPVVFKLEQVKE